MRLTHSAPCQQLSAAECFVHSAFHVCDHWLNSSLYGVLITLKFENGSFEGIIRLLCLMTEITIQNDPFEGQGVIPSDTLAKVKEYLLS